MTQKKSEGLNVEFDQHFLAQELADSLFAKFQNEIEWQHLSIKMFGKSVLQPRLQAWMGDKKYTYSGLEMTPEPWHPALMDIKTRIEETYNIPINSVLINLYRDGMDYMGYHRDNEKALGHQPVIASVSLGAERKFVFRRRDKTEKVEFFLPHGSLLIMQGDTQTEWEHALPKMRKIDKPRINLTFRYIVDL
ncbi:alpha-ketoglutarate-dependent dioxygenase AlkB family protein [Thaumasiovibrio subtropicus]|uniref:alpha-ketoglutarate-dependent dioxygenase AlkB family protein n=1 Tax=Thaumasiovibrio subtropicus TaxID=1891207 RepID=UPI000B35CE96|nr:alpha-ketoglutarate-dependent dioxygenase AlkB [Thaumasiovibrio subtropicus]